MHREKAASQNHPERIPVLPIRSTIVFPGGATALQIGFAPNVEALSRHPESDLVVAMVSTVEDDFPPRALEKIATAVRVLDRLNLPGGTIQTTLQGLRRIRLADVRLEDGYYSAVAKEVKEIAAPAEEADPLVEKIVATVTAVASTVERIPDEVPRVLRMNLGDPGRFADLTATLCNLKLPLRDAVLQEPDVLARLKLVLHALEEEWEHVREVEHATATGEEGGGPLPAGGRERRDEIRRRIQALQAELGEIDPVEREANEALRVVERAQLPPRMAAVARREAERLRSTSVTSSEAQEIRGYIDTLTELPWTRQGDGGSFDLEAVRAQIEGEHLGLDEPKRRLLEVLA
ncbi:MAG TPA: LON peptidase substrate-binding domain-containing protein, partial [Longimicrobium sp.]|nr:LON peptidase substrate-binding domain-containing protein [Longimicrobium sp.]